MSKIPQTHCSHLFESKYNISTLCGEERQSADKLYCPAEGPHTPKLGAAAEAAPVALFDTLGKRETTF